jgi:hypothetical protein
LALSPDDGALKQLAAVVYFQQGKTVLDTTDNHAAALDWMRKAHTLQPAQTAIEQGMAGVYLQWAQALMAQDAPPETVLAKARQAMPLAPNDPSVKRSVANLTLNLAGQSKDKAQQKALLAQAVSTDNSPEVAQAAARIAGVGNPLNTLKAMNPLATPSKSAIASGLHPFLAGESQRPSALQAVNQLALALNTPLPPDTSLEQALPVLEQAYYGPSTPSPDTGTGLAGRLNGLYTAVIGPQTTTPSPDYLKEVLALTQGKVTRFRVMPVRVYVAPPNPKVNDPATGRPAVPASLKTALGQGLMAWRKATLGYVDYVWVTQPEQADIHIVWSDGPYQSPFGAEALARTTEHYSKLRTMEPSKLGKVLKVAGSFAPGYFGIVPQVGAVAADYHIIQAVGFLKKEATITLPRAWAQSAESVAMQHQLGNVMTVETGRVLGLKAPALSQDSVTRINPVMARELVQPSRTDVATLRQLYLRPVDFPMDLH